MELFQSQRETIKDDILKVFPEFAKDVIIHGVTNETYICLMLKKANSSKVKDFWSISLVTSLYKIISKVLLLRLKGVLEDTIVETQGAFVAGRQILDVILVVNEIVEEYMKAERTSVDLKIDFEKAYVYMECGFLDFVLEKKKFWFYMEKMDFGMLFNGLLFNFH